MKSFQKIVSYTFQPFSIPSIGMILLMFNPFFEAYPILYKLEAIFGTFLFTAGFPSILILFMIKKGDIDNFFISKKEQRTIPYIFSLVCYFFWISFLWKTLYFPPELLAMAIGMLITALLMLLINLKWKISVHNAAMGCLSGCIISVCYFTATNPALFIITSFIIAGLVAISRVYLKAHTLYQTLSGYILGMTIVFIMVWLSQFIY